jgi:hypothetical protein
MAKQRVMVEPDLVSVVDGHSVVLETYKCIDAPLYGVRCEYGRGTDLTPAVASEFFTECAKMVHDNMEKGKKK